MKLSSDAIKFVNNLVDQGTPLNDFDYQYITASIIQATPRSQLPGIHETEKDDQLLDLIAAYMKSHEPADGQDILDYMVTNLVNYYSPTIEDLINDKISETESCKKEAQEEANYQEYIWNKERA